MSYTKSQSKIKWSLVMFLASVASVMMVAYMAPNFKTKPRFAMRKSGVAGAIKLIGEVRNEKGEVTSRPTLIALVGDEALIMQGENQGKNVYYKIKPELSNDEMFIETSIEYGSFEGLVSNEKEKIKFIIEGTGHIKTPSSLSTPEAVMSLNRLKLRLSNLPAPVAKN